MKNCALRSQPFASLIATVMALFLTSYSFGICYLTNSKNIKQKIVQIREKLKKEKISPTNPAANPGIFELGGPDIKGTIRYISNTTDNDIIEENRNQKFYVVSDKNNVAPNGFCFAAKNGIAFLNKSDINSNGEPLVPLSDEMYKTIKTSRVEPLLNQDEVYLYPSLKNSHLCIYELPIKTLVCFVE